MSIKVDENKKIECQLFTDSYLTFQVDKDLQEYEILESQSMAYLKQNRTWIALPKSKSVYDDRFTDRLYHSIVSLDKCVEVDVRILSGIPVLIGTRMPIARIVAEVAEGHSIHEIADDYDLNEELIVVFFEGLASYLNRPFTK